MTPYLLLPLSLATLYVTWRLVDLTGSLIAGCRCICSRHTWRPDCPVHGTQASAGRSSGEAMYPNKETE